MFDLGRSERENAGLITFKERFGATSSPLTYVRLLDSAQSKGAFVPAGADFKERIARKVLPHLPDPALRAAGALLRRHLG